MEQIESVKEWDGWLNRYTHQSKTCQCEMTFSVYLPAASTAGSVPVLYWLSGLTCTDDNFRTKAGAQRYAAEHGIALVIPDTSPRGDDVPDEPERYDLGHGAGFYVNSTTERWKKNFQMYDYIVSELPALVESKLPLDGTRRAISGHSMGGHGALICALKNPGMYKSASAFAPICNPINCDWGKGCFDAYLGDDLEAWKSYDATCLVNAGNGSADLPLKVDQGGDDEFLADYLAPEALVEACAKQGLSLDYNLRDGYDHSYHFIATYFGDHMTFHARALKKA